MSTVAQLDDSTGRIPPLVAGDRLTRDEFERRCDAMPEVKRAELFWVAGDQSSGSMTGESRVQSRP